MPTGSPTAGGTGRGNCKNRVVAATQRGLEPMNPSLELRSDMNQGAEPAKLDRLPGHRPSAHKVLTGGVKMEEWFSLGTILPKPWNASN